MLGLRLVVSVVSAAVFVRPAKIRVPVAVAHLVAPEVLIMIRMMMIVEMLAAVRILTMPSIVPVEAVINVTPEVVMPMEPWSCADKDASREPFRPIVAIRRAFIWRIVEIPVRALRWRPDLYRDLGVCLLGRSRKTESGDRD